MAHRKVVLCLLGATLAASLFSGVPEKSRTLLQLQYGHINNGDQLDTFKELDREI